MGSEQTAMARTKLSVPAKYLRDKGLIVGRALDYGCGRGFDAKTLGIEGYDPYWNPIETPRGAYDTILCTYVLNVIESTTDRAACLLQIHSKLREGGIAYITVRNDQKKLVGKTSKGWQGHITLDLPVEYNCARHVIYRWGPK